MQQSSETIILQKESDPLQGKESEEKMMALSSNDKPKLYSEITERCSMSFTFTNTQA